MLFEIMNRIRKTNQLESMLSADSLGGSLLSFHFHFVSCSVGSEVKSPFCHVVVVVVVVVCLGVISVLP